MEQRIVKVRRGKLLSCDEAGELLGISTNQIRLWVRMRLLHAEKLGHVYVIQAEQLALASERFHRNLLDDVPLGRSGLINKVELE